MSARTGCSPHRMVYVRCGRTLSIFVEVIHLKNRERQRQNRRLKHKEELLDKYSNSGYKDLTPYNAVLAIKSKSRYANAVK